MAKAWAVIAGVAAVSAVGWVLAWAKAATAAPAPIGPNPRVPIQPPREPFPEPIRPVPVVPEPLPYFPPGAPLAPGQTYAVGTKFISSGYLWTITEVEPASDGRLFWYSMWGYEISNPSNQYGRSYYQADVEFLIQLGG